MQAQQQKPNIGQKAPPRKTPWLRIVFLMLIVLVIIILGFFLVQNNADSSATLLSSIFIVIAVLTGIGQIIPILFPPASSPPTNTNQNQQHPSQPLPDPPIPPTPILAPNEPSTPSPMHKLQAPQPTSFSMEPVFYPNVPHLPNSDELYGRELERIQLLDHTHRGGSISIVGPRSSGKTWLLDYLKLMATPDFQIAHIDDTTTVSGFVARVLTDFGILLPGTHTNLELGMLTQVIESFQGRNVKPVLCIDRFESLFNRDELDYDFFGKLRYITTRGLRLVIASRKPLIYLTDKHGQASPFFNICEQIKLKAFNKAEAERFANKKSIQAGFNSNECTALLKYGQESNQEWSPLRLQRTGDMLWMNKKAAIRGDSSAYRPADKDYWDDFQRKLDEMS